MTPKPRPKKPIPKTIDDYLCQVPADSRAALQRMRKLITTAAPHAQEGIAYGFPTFRQGRMRLNIAAFKAEHRRFQGSLQLLRVGPGPSRLLRRNHAVRNRPGNASIHRGPASSRGSGHTHGQEADRPRCGTGDPVALGPAPAEGPQRVSRGRFRHGARNVRGNCAQSSARGALSQPAPAHGRGVPPLFGQDSARRSGEVLSYDRATPPGRSPLPVRERFGRSSSGGPEFTLGSSWGRCGGLQEAEGFRTRSGRADHCDGSTRNPPWALYLLPSRT